MTGSEVEPTDEHVADGKVLGHGRHSHSALDFLERQLTGMFANWCNQPIPALGATVRVASGATVPLRKLSLARPPWSSCRRPSQQHAQQWPRFDRATG